LAKKGQTKIPRISAKQNRDKITTGLTGTADGKLLAPMWILKKNPKSME